MKRTSNSPSPMEIFVKAGLIAALAAVLLMPTRSRSPATNWRRASNMHGRC